MKRVAVLDGTFTIRNRIKELAARANIEVIETTTPKQLMNILNAPNDIGLIITELEFPSEDGFAVFSEIKSRAGETPVMILTAENRRVSFVKGIRLGAADYVLKPFDGEFLFKRIVDLMGTESTGLPIPAKGAIMQGIPAMYVDFKSYVDKELKKAGKGRYAVSIMISLLIDPGSEMSASLDRRYQRISNEIHHDLSAALFDTDLFMKYGSRSFIGVFPFCSPENQELIDEKLKQVFQVYKSRNNMEQTTLLLSNFASYPEDGHDREELMAIVEARMTEAIRKAIPGEAEELL